MTYKSTLRDRVVWRLSNWLLNNVATREYRGFVSLLMKFGRERLDEEFTKEETK